MRIDAYTHFIPEKFFNKIVESGHHDIGKRVREIPCIHDIEMRRKIVDGFKDYAQIISYPMPPLELLAKGDAALVEECLLYTSPSPRDRQKSRMPSSA